MLEKGLLERPRFGERSNAQGEVSAKREAGSGDVVHRARAIMNEGDIGVEMRCDFRNYSRRHS